MTATLPVAISICVVRPPPDEIA